MLCYVSLHGESFMTVTFFPGEGGSGIGSVGLLQLMSEFGYDIRSGI